MSERIAGQRQKLSDLFIGPSEEMKDYREREAQGIMASESDLFIGPSEEMKVRPVDAPPCVRVESDLFIGPSEEMKGGASVGGPRCSRYVGPLYRTF